MAASTSWIRSGWFVVFGSLALALDVSGETREFIQASVKVDLRKAERRIDPYFVGMGLHPGEGEYIKAGSNAGMVKDFLGLKSIRFPNGCEADRYGWSVAASKGFITVDEYLDFCDRSGCRPYYIINMQGGTEALEGPIPQGAELDERIKYRHLAPNPCGYAPGSYYYGTVAETVRLVERYTIERVVAGKTPILDFEMGNENWGQATTDWPPEVYVRTVAVYAKAMREAVKRAKQRHSELQAAELRLTAVGYPIMGNNQDPQKATDHGINVAWTQGLNRLHEDGLIDAVQEHFYPYSIASGDALVWTEHNLKNIILARQGIPNPRLDGYVDLQLAYNMPMDFTEWNLKCWGPAPRFFTLPNGEFELGLSNWATKASPAGAARFGTSGAAARHGGSGLWIRTGSGCSWAEARQSFPCKGRSQLTILIWIRTDTPTNVSLIMRNGGRTIMERTATARNYWQRYSVEGKLVSTNAPVEVALRVDAPNVTAWFDNVEAAYYDAGASRAPLSVDTFEQQLFCVDAIRQMLQQGAERTFLHHLFGSYGCPAIKAGGIARENAKAFGLYAGCIGQVVLRVETKAGTFDYDGQGGKWATDFNALAPATKKVPFLSTLATRSGNRVSLLLLNRSTDRTVRTKVRLPSAPKSRAEIRTLSGRDCNAYGAELSVAMEAVGKMFTRDVAPHSAQMVSFDVSREPLEPLSP